MIKIGDRVKFVSDTGVGIVRSIKKGIAQVEVDGFEIPALVSDIVVVDSENEAEVRRRIGPSTPQGGGSKKTQKNNSSSYGRISLDDGYEDDEPIDIMALKKSYASQQKSQVKDQKAPEPIVVAPPFTLTDIEVLLAFEPTVGDRLPEESDINLTLINDSTYQLYYSIGRWERGGYITTLSCGVIEEDTQLFIHKFARRDLANITKLHISVMPFKHTSYVPQQMVDTDIELHPLKFVRPHSYQTNDFTERRAILFTLLTNQ